MTPETARDIIEDVHVEMLKLLSAASPERKLLYALLIVLDRRGLLVRTE